MKSLAANQDCSPRRRCFRDPDEAFAARTEWQEDCLVWVGATNARGYGVMRVRGSVKKAHRYAWEKANGEIPDGLELDHICHNPACCNVAHLRLATRKQNNENQNGAQKNNRSSGVRGVYWDKRNAKWYAQVSHHGRAIHVGRFETISEANQAATSKRNELFTHNDRDRIGARK